MNIFAGILLVALLLFYVPACCADGAFHAPDSDAEKALDHILDSDRILDSGQQKSPGFHEFMIGADKLDKSHEDAYGAMFTKPLLAAWRLAERKAVRVNCHGHYQKGELCGIDYDMLTCAQDEADTYLYRTDVDDGHVARIAYKWLGNEPEVASYVLVKEGGQWRLDGVDCLIVKNSFHIK
jgi:hypothetical protein